MGQRRRPQRLRDPWIREWIADWAKFPASSPSSRSVARSVRFPHQSDLGRSMITRQRRSGVRGALMSPKFTARSPKSGFYVCPR